MRDVKKVESIYINTTINYEKISAFYCNECLVEREVSGNIQLIDNSDTGCSNIFLVRDTSYSGVEVIRDLLKKDTGNKLIAPVVFSCNYDEVMVPVLFEKKLGKLDYISTQTPQVLIDFQILKMTEGILFSWDVVDEAFCEGTIDTMFDCYMKALEDLIEQPDSWNKKIEFMELSSFPERYENIATLGKTNGYIHDKVFENMEKKSNNIAVLETDTHKSITYQELKIKVENLMCILIEFGVHKGDKVGIYLPKGSNQIVAVLAILGIGACYVPIGVNQALQRMRGMLLKANIKTIISDENGKKYLQENVQQNIVLVNAKNAVKSSCDTMPDSTERSAYIIFTSGTTGEPKGVEISHRSAWNTINEVNKICCVDEHSKILSVSALEFDLSVYDIFGILSEGGTVVVTSENARRDAAVWANAIMDYNITVWNSVPYLLNMLLTVAETEGKVFPSLKKVILSGDWIGLDLPERLKRIAPNAEMLAMGGATEAAIWSNFIQVQLPLPSKWVSIPYGKPLAGQLYRVVDQAGKDCPNWVSGELWIGGDGVAKGYISDGYIEMSFDKVLDIKRLEIAWNKVIQKHDMLRAIVSNSGYQIVQEAVPYVTIQCLDLRITEGNNETDKNDFRRRLANKQYELGKWPMCDLALTVENEKSIIHLSLDMLIADFVSTNIILHDLETFYENPDLIIVPTTLYRDVVLYQNQKRTIKTVERNVAEKYWSDKIPSMGEAPDLPLKDDYALDNAKFTQKKVFLNHDMWMSFVENARKFKVTPSILIMASFAEVLGLWSSNNKFCINTTILNRPDVTQDVNKIVGDFTDVNVTAIALDFSKNFIERARTIQNDLWVDLEHNAFSGVEVLRKMTKDRKKNIIIPVVYTSTVGMAADDDMTVKNPITYKISQTPQVYIDCQAAEENNGCTINWDVREGVFDDFIIEAMFESFKELLLSSCETLNNRFEEKQPVYLPSDMRSVREKINDTKESISPYMMMEGFAGSLEKYSNKTALITPNGEYTYSSLAKYVATVYDILKKEGVGKGDIVGVDISKGVWQIASVLGILFAEALYVPLDTNQPLKRKEKIVNSAGINLMLTEQENLVLSNNCKVLNVTEIKTLKDSFEIPAIEKDYDRPAYIIFTSGTTGEPKGVIITHRAAMNTICNINQKYNITERDVFFGLANLSFDLSVYDIFGCYQVGGTLVLPDSSSIKDPKQLTELLVVHGVTVWNSVPAQMQMVINYMENSKVNSNIELRVVLLSGDWIPVNLPKKIYEKFNKSRVVSLGGATEASIWSIYYDIQREDDFEKSIPYGYPLANQKFYVLNENLQSCPDYVVGSLYIAGVGLSAGYLNDEKLNQEKYKYLPETGEKIYKTGDIGCYTRDGIILFKGREAGDEQVKIHGHRVELAEIRSVLNEHPLVESSVVLAMGESAEDLHINAVVAPVKKKELTSIHITNAEKENLEKLEKYYEEEIDQDLFERWINKSEEVVTSDIFNTFRCYSIWPWQKGK